ncbi:hypothetical protein BV898_17088 [Hypsibius exemplaris]|uniref:Uncharacterized protein n=1 Tax=Hypsibius exemplaris TaxID=2072580 RepID=A0A9X6RMH4_HYPEX|nr:hypothetical protein BV898_17088 [Hypsibius exemplaris]
MMTDGRSQPLSCILASDRSFQLFHNRFITQTNRPTDRPSYEGTGGPFERHHAVWTMNGQSGYLTVTSLLWQTVHYPDRLSTFETDRPPPQQPSIVEG